MKTEDLKSYFDANKELWNNKIDTHINSAFYDNASFLEGRNTLNPFEMEYLGDVSGKKILHIQCHFGQDSISLARMGAKVTATDISNKALEKARLFNTQCGTDVTFIETDTYHINNHVTDTFDIIFMSYGVKCWLPDMHKLASIVNSRLKPGGKVISVEFHPVLDMFDYPTQKIQYSYHNVHVYEEELEGTYADQHSELKGKEYFWQHSLDEVITPYIQLGMRMSAFKEYYHSPYNAFENVKEIEKGKYVYGDFPYPIPHVYLTEFTKE
ncbi:MAG: class I SAM-dependent methyltransferase [Saprospiraceae bacterium]|nr:class I SAM-dependent methyltransferase [Saprospiraceae bacterium]